MVFEVDDRSGCETIGMNGVQDFDPGGGVSVDEVAVVGTTLVCQRRATGGVD